MTYLARTRSASITSIFYVAMIRILVTDGNIIEHAVTLLVIAENKAIQSRLVAKGSTIVAGVCENSCMFTCMKEKNCMAYTFDANDASCKMWDHQVIELIDRQNAKSVIRSMNDLLTYC